MPTLPTFFRPMRTPFSGKSADTGLATKHGVHRRALRVILPCLSLAAAGLTEDLLARSGVLDAARFPPLGRIAFVLADEIASGRIWTPLRATGVDWLVALLLSFVLALTLAAVLNLSARLRDYSAPVIAFLRPMPCTALIPIVIVSLGANAQGLIFLTTFGTVWQMLPILTQSIGRVDGIARDTARVFGFTPAQRFRWVELRALEPHLLSALRIGATASLVLLIGMELLTGASGIGRMISFTYAGSNLTLMYAYVTVSGLLGVLVNLLLGRAVAAHARSLGARQ